MHIPGFRGIFRGVWSGLYGLERIMRYYFKPLPINRLCSLPTLLAQCLHRVPHNTVTGLLCSQLAEFYPFNLETNERTDPDT